MTIEDVEKWAWIVSADSADQIAERFLSASCMKPPFLLLEILRRDILQVRNLNLLLGWTWHQLAGTPWSSSGTLPEPELDAITIPPSEEMLGHKSPPDHFKIEDSTSIMIISRLLSQARRIWPAAVVSISHMTRLLIRSIPESKSEEPVVLDPRMHHRLCKIHNQTLRLLALPASINPLRSMSHNWQAQRVLIEMIGQFDPPLTLNQDSYRAVAQVLAGSKKSERESRVASLRKRSWPPWRIDQDGMDAQRSLEDDFSRVVSAGMRTKEAGYSDSVEDQVMRIIGGQEADGTPTIQTRKLIKRRLRPADRNSDPEFEPDLWAARIEATRDIQEAWGAFKNFEDQGNRASPRMYLAMFEKLNYNEARFRERAQYEAAPGDGKEVLIPSNDNMTPFYQRRLSPPTFDELYDKMILSGTRPTGRLLTFLLSHARTIECGLQYLRESQVNSQAVAFLAGDREIPPAVLHKVPGPTFAAFITFLCRFAPRAMIVEASLSKKHDTGDAFENENDQDTELARAKHEYHILEPRSRLGESVPNTLHRSIELLKASKTRYRPAWYALFQALARRNVMINRHLVGDQRNDLLSWQVLFAALGDFQRLGLELDAQGFLIICRGLEKAVLASFDMPLEERSTVFAECPMTVVTDEFLKLSETDDIETPYAPELLHSIHGVHLHAYVRILGLVEDYAGIIRLLQWMSRHHEALESISAQSRNGQRLFRRVFIAMRAFLNNTSYDDVAKKLVDSVEAWDGWPEELEAQEYLEIWSRKETTEDEPE